MVLAELLATGGEMPDIQQGRIVAGDFEGAFLDVLTMTSSATAKGKTTKE